VSTVTVGVDIGSDSLKVVGLERQARGFRLVGLNHVTVPANSWTADELKNQEEIAKTLVAALRSSKPSAISGKKVMIALPESVVYSGTFALPQLAPKELAQAVPYEIAEKLSVNLEEYFFDYESTTSLCQPLTEKLADESKAKNEPDSKKAKEPPAKNAAPAVENGVGTAVFAVATKRSLVQSIITMCQIAKVELAGLDIKPGAVARSVVALDDHRIRLIVDLGASATGVSVAEGRALRLTSSVPMGTKSFSDNPKNTLKTFAAKAGPIFDEVLHITKFFENRVCPGTKIQETIVTGGGSNIEGLAEYFANETGLPTVIGEPFKQIDVHHFPLNTELSRIFADAAGLAMRDSREK